MRTFLIKETLEECPPEKLRELRGDLQFAAVLSSREWTEDRAAFDMGIEMELHADGIDSTKAEVNYDSLTGHFFIPDRADLSERASSHHFAFALDEKGIVFIDNGSTAMQLIDYIRETKRWRMPGLERFLYDFLEAVIREDHALLVRYESELSDIEDALVEKPADHTPFMERVNEIRSDMRVLKQHYEQLIDMGEELEENENSFFEDQYLRYFHLFTARVERLRDIVTNIREYTLQIRELSDSQIETKQNHIMTILTVVTTIFMPLTLIAGWYGMNFKYMPELDSPYAYPIVFIVSLAILVGGLFYFHHRKWL